MSELEQAQDSQEPGREVYAVSSGSYSDYSVHCIFELRDDALTYARSLADSELRRTHKYMIELVPERRWSGFTPHTEPESECAVCVRLRGDWSGSTFGNYGVEPFQFFPSGDVPVVAPRPEGAA